MSTGDPKVDPVALKKLLDEADVGARTRSKIERANEGESTKTGDKSAKAKPRPAGHGNAAPAKAPARF